MKYGLGKESKYEVLWRRKLDFSKRLTEVWPSLFEYFAMFLNKGFDSRFQA